jgi:hypothetical protein
MYTGVTAATLFLFVRLSLASLFGTMAVFVEFLYKALLVLFGEHPNGGLSRQSLQEQFFARFGQLSILGELDIKLDEQVTLDILISVHRHTLMRYNLNSVYRKSRKR